MLAEMKKQVRLLHLCWFSFTNLLLGKPFAQECNEGPHPWLSHPSLDLYPIGKEANSFIWCITLS